MSLRGEAANRPTYRNLRPVGSGSSEAFVGYHDIFEDEVFQKTVPLTATVVDAVLRNEPQVLRHLDHRAIPVVREAQYDPGRSGHLTMVMDIVGDHDAGDVVLGKQPALSIGELVSVALDLLDALEYLHSRVGVVHRDIKPDNIRLSTDHTRAWLIDFNLVSRLDGGVADGVATPFPWMAPEVPDHGYSVRSELFSVGVVLSELLRGEQMLAHSTLERAEARVLEGKPAFPLTHYRRFPAHVPRSLKRVLTKATAADPAARYATAAEMARALRGLVYVDWARTSMSAWQGSWPSNVNLNDRVTLTLEAQDIVRGKNAGRRRVKATYSPSQAARRLPGVSDRVISNDDALAQFFSDVDKVIAKLRPAE